MTITESTYNLSLILFGGIAIVYIIWEVVGSFEWIREEREEVIKPQHRKYFNHE